MSHGEGIADADHAAVIDLEVGYGGIRELQLTGGGYGCGSVRFGRQIDPGKYRAVLMITKVPET